MTRAPANASQQAQPDTYEVRDQGFAYTAPQPLPGYRCVRSYQWPPASNYFIFVYEKIETKEAPNE